MNKAVIIFFIAIPFLTYSQPNDSSQQVNKKRLTGFVLGSTVAYGITLVGLNELWYKDSPHQSFRFFNDNREWKQVDKLGHFYSSFYLSYTASASLKWCGVKSRRADLIGALTGFGIMLPIEIFDGFSAAYGASTGDLIANTAGAAFFLGQRQLWNEIRIYPKFSFHRSDYAPVRPSVLGDGMPEEIFKDYNGQTHWLSFDMDKFITFPRWLNLAVGYGAESMIYARDEQSLNAGLPLAYRQYYLSVDIDLRAIRSRSKFVNTLIFVASMIKLPAPALEFSRKGATFHAFYF